MKCKDQKVKRKPLHGRKISKIVHNIKYGQCQSYKMKCFEGANGAYNEGNNS